MSGARRFDPRPGDSLSLFGESFTVSAHPSAPFSSYSAEGRRGFVYQLVSTGNEVRALKTFKPAFRKPDLEGVARRLGPLSNMPGLRAARRRIVQSSDPVVKTFSDLEFAMLMPWIRGKTWFDLLVSARLSGVYLEKQRAMRVCERLLFVLKELEKREFAHTDISPGNVMIGPADLSVELLDLEDFYSPQSPPPKHRNLGSAGYQHRGSRAEIDLWCREADRYAGAVLAAEILILANPALAPLATDEGFFAGDDRSTVGQERFRASEDWLRIIAPEFSPLFCRSWSAPTLQECTSLVDLHSAISRMVSGPIPLGELIVARELRPYVLSKNPPATENQPVREWKTLSPGGWKATSEPLSNQASQTLSSLSSANRKRSIFEGFLPVLIGVGVGVSLGLVLASSTGEAVWLYILSVLGLFVGFGLSRR